ncbi:MAG: lipid hydroperoxide peroxidase [Bdellovibrionales bacterium RIFOXYD12_FULL_39_22]|nr:MAG: lipid hydroperoxide peroxidase [Bdellovibrionales bacterium RIFOXYB1_FULL_39_21]OFZ41962.1 MAG: lipid hydroperoxide peroxidase [Bdellovibrionales bacterium RIFOXYC12_FULL_39_17]OFZ50678.1 MAG: lipid hydroperoxide peroxidase [Bdellovibrionales bacterium RIFOXYC1_FULL_39_130]OFZ74036.1 MAG: lipid hydroperoxide peroxidase [Bdellovibrionales bacterium RIFOXYC2_FULL_39_8]OFZ77901.1 MAG: lipid hydroperoxide peroxidase [Bdellovibrionales bacterium RIFOXYD1_FULL_39_84]OFZ93663.1 MAG: lipid hyd
MTKITLKGNSINTSGSLPALKSMARDFKLTKSDLSDVSLKDFSGKRKILNIVPSLDTGICAASARRFNNEASKIKNTVILTISCDLPFAQKRFCEAEGIANVVMLSELRSKAFGEDYGVRIIDGPLAGLLSRAIVVLDENNKVIYTEQVPEIAQEPQYDKALAAVS